jgi:hypothetical protein
MMNHRNETSTDGIRTSLLVRGGLALLVLLALLIASAHGQSQSENASATISVHVTHVLGFEGVRRNASGDLSIQDNDLRFQRNGNPATQVSVTSIRNISLGEQDKQVGGVPMMLGKAALPYSGGRVVSLFSHKKYDSLTIEYRDNSGGLHGAIFRLAKGQAETFKTALIAHGAHITGSEDPAPVQSTREEPMAAQKWNVQVERVDPGATTLDPSFSDAIYENLLRELPKSKQFKDVFRSGDRNANDVSGVLVLKTLVERYSPGSETRRAVTTITGATKVKVHIQLLTRDGQVLLERSIGGNVRFMGENLSATNKVATHTRKALKQSSFPAPSALIPQQSPSREATVTL